MKFGIDPPWYDNSIERVAFNLYAMDQESRTDKIENYIHKIIAGDYDAVLGFNPTDRELHYIIEELAAAGIEVTIDAL